MSIVEFRRQRGSSGQWMSRSKPLIKLEIPRGQVVVFKQSMEMMDFKHNEAVMFGFNKKEKCGYIFKEEPQDDSYYLRDNGKGYSRFTSKDLMNHMCDIFGVSVSDEKKNVYFRIETEPNEKGMYKFVVES